MTPVSIEITVVVAIVVITIGSAVASAFYTLPKPWEKP